MTFDPSDHGIDFDFLDCTEQWEPSAEDFRDLIAAEDERRYDAWLDFGAPFDFTGASYADEWDEPRAAADWERNLEQMIEDACRRIEEGKASIILDRGDLDWLGAFDEECLDRSQGTGDDAPKIADMGLYIEILGAGNLIHKCNPTFWPRLRKFGPTPEMLREANAILGGQEFEREAKARTRPRPTHTTAKRRTCSRARSSHGAAPARRQGSRRVTASSRAGPSDDDGESEPPGLRLWRHLDHLPVDVPLRVRPPSPCGGGWS